MSSRHREHSAAQVGLNKGIIWEGFALLTVAAGASSAASVRSQGSFMVGGCAGTASRWPPVLLLHGCVCRSGGAGGQEEGGGCKVEARSLLLLLPPLRCRCVAPTSERRLRDHVSLCCWVALIPQPLLLLLLLLPVLLVRVTS